MSDDNTNKLLAAVLDTVNSLRDDLKDHIKEEDAELVEIRKSSEQRHLAAEARHLELIDELRKINIVEALPRDEDGKPDIKGHRNEHEHHRRRWDGVREFSVDLLKGGLKYSFAVGGLWIVYTLWQAFIVSVNK